MSIRKHIEFDGKKNRGFIDFGTGLEDDNLPAAGSVLVFMAVAVNASWKIPVAYFFINSLTAAEKVNITTLVVEKLISIDVKIISITYDGPTTNVSMAREFGLNLEDGQFNTALEIQNEKIYFILDNCDMVKLMRNALFQQEVFFDADGFEINVKYIKELQKLQETERLHLANKITNSHLNWQGQAMKVKLAVQTLSASTADVIDFCCNDLQLPPFQGSAATTKFIRFCDRLFDICNSRNPLSQNYKAPLKLTNAHVWRPFLEEAFAYIGVNDYLECDPPRLKYLLTYKMSQDHLELFYSSVRSRGGYNNNPTAKQFIASYKRLLVHHELVHNNSNCLAIDNTSILNVTSTLANTRQETASHSEIISRYRLFPDTEIDHDYLPNLSYISSYVENIVEYVGGFVVRKLQSTITCIDCSKALYSDVNSTGSLISRKTNGKLIYPSSIDLYN